MENEGYIEEFEQELPAVDADFKHWGKMPYWTLDECVALLLGQDPTYVNWDIAKDYQEWPYTTELSLNYAKLRALILRANKNQEITDPITPAVFLKWAESRDLEIPSELIQQIGIVKRKQFLLDEETQEILRKKEEEISALKKRIQELESLIWDGFDENQSTYSKELAIAVKAHGAISKNWKKGSSIKQQITLWLETHYPKLMNEEKERIAKICNWQKSGGAPSTPG
jgi:hypothetical protein